MTTFLCSRRRKVQCKRAKRCLQFVCTWQGTAVVAVLFILVPWLHIYVVRGDAGIRQVDDPELSSVRFGRRVRAMHLISTNPESSLYSMRRSEHTTLSRLRMCARLSVSRLPAPSASRRRHARPYLSAAPSLFSISLSPKLTRGAAIVS